MTHYAGLDVLMKETAICIVDERGAIVREGIIASEPDDIAAWLSETNGTPEPVRLEIGGIARWLYAAGLRERANGAIPLPETDLRNWATL